MKLKPVLIPVCFLTIFLLGFVPTCHGADISNDVQISAGSAIARGPAAVLDLAFMSPAGFLPDDGWKLALTLIGTSQFQGQEVANNFAVRGLYVAGVGNFNAGLGISWMQNYLPYNGAHENLTLELAYRFQRLPVTLTYAHMSDADSRRPNYGRDLLMLGWRFGDPSSRAAKSRR